MAQKQALLVNDILIVLSVAERVKNEAFLLREVTDKLEMPDKLKYHCIGGILDRVHELISTIRGYELDVDYDLMRVRQDQKEANK